MATRRIVLLMFIDTEFPTVTIASIFQWFPIAERRLLYLTRVEPIKIRLLVSRLPVRGADCRFPITKLKTLSYCSYWWRKNTLRVISTHLVSHKDRNTRARVVEVCEIGALARAFWHMVRCHSRHLAPIQFRCATGTCARARARAHLLAFHARDPIRTTTGKARRCQHVCQHNERNPSTCEIGRASSETDRERDSAELSRPRRARGLALSREPVKSLKRRLRNGGNIIMDIVCLDDGNSEGYGVSCYAVLPRTWNGRA